MAATVKELREWLDGFHDDFVVAINEGGLTLEIIGTNGPSGFPTESQAIEASRRPYFELGGIPEVDNDFTQEQKLEMYRNGNYVFSPPAVSTGNWTEADWIGYIDMNDGWKPEVQS